MVMEMVEVLGDDEHETKF